MEPHSPHWEQTTQISLLENVHKTVLKLDEFNLYLPLRRKEERKEMRKNGERK